MVLTFKKILSIRTIPLIELQILEKEKCTLHITARLMLLTCARHIFVENLLKEPDIVIKH